MGASLISFAGWADSWGNSWGATVTDPNALSGAASFSITASLQVNSGDMQGSASFSFDATLQLVEPPRSYSLEIELRRRRVYLRRGKQILLFNNAAEADRYEEAERIADEAIAKAQSKRAVKRLKAKVIQVAPPVELIDTGVLVDLMSAYSVPINLPQLLAEQDYSQLAQIYLRLREQQEEDDIEALLLA